MSPENAEPQPRKPLVLIIRDGWGKNPDPKQNDTNAVHLAKKPCDELLHAKEAEVTEV